MHGGGRGGLRGTARSNDLQAQKHYRHCSRLSPLRQTNVQAAAAVLLSVCRAIYNSAEIGGGAACIGLAAHMKNFFIVEGPGDENALAPALEQMILLHNVKFKVMHTDITSDLASTADNIERRIKTQAVKKFYELAKHCGASNLSSASRPVLLRKRTAFFCVCSKNVR